MQQGVDLDQLKERFVPMGPEADDELLRLFTPSITATATPRDSAGASCNPNADTLTPISSTSTPTIHVPIKLGVAQGGVQRAVGEGFPAGDADFKLYGWRYLVLVGFSIINCVNALMWISFSPVISLVTEWYDVSDLKANMLSLVFMIAFVTVTPVAAWMMDGLGLRFTLWAGAFLTMLGCWVRLADNTSYNLCLVGQVLAAVAQPMISIAPPKIAGQWFGSEERTLATAVGTASNFFGCAIGFVASPLLVKNAGDVPQLMLYQSIAGTVAMVAALAFVRSRPATPPSVSAALEVKLSDGLRHLVCSKLYYVVGLLFGIGFGGISSIAIYVGEICKPLGYSPTQAGILGGVTILAGLLGMVVAALLVDKYSCYCSVVVGGFLLAVLAGVLMEFAMGKWGLSIDEKLFWFVLMAAAAGLMGFALMGTFPVMMELACEYAYPCPEGLCTGVLMMLSQVIGLGISFGMKVLKDDKTGSMANSLWLVTGLCAVGLLLSTTLKSDYKRSKVESAMVGSSMRLVEGGV